MPAYTAGNVMDDSAAALNDAAKSLWTYTVQLPYLKMALRDLDQKLQLVENPVTLMNESEQTVAANQTELILPASFFLPIKLEEKGSTDVEWIPMEERVFEDDRTIQKSNTLRWWSWRHNCVNLLGSTVERQVKLTYWRTMPELVNENSNILVNGARNYLAFRTAFYCSAFVGKNQLVMKVMIDLAGEAWDTISSLLIKNNQGKRTRRLPFRVMTRR